jgi:hypothetical protein
VRAALIVPQVQPFGKPNRARAASGGRFANSIRKGAGAALRRPYEIAWNRAFDIFF